MPFEYTVFVGSEWSDEHRKIRQNAKRATYLKIMKTITAPQVRSASLSLLKIRVSSMLPANCSGYVDFLTEENFNNLTDPNLLRLEELLPGTLAEFKNIALYSAYLAEERAVSEFEDIAEKLSQNPLTAESLAGAMSDACGATTLGHNPAIIANENGFYFGSALNVSGNDIIAVDLQEGLEVLIGSHPVDPTKLTYADLLPLAKQFLPEVLLSIAQYKLDHDLGPSYATRDNGDIIAYVDEDVRDTAVISCAEGPCSGDCLRPIDAGSREVLDAIAAGTVIVDEGYLETAYC